MPDEIGGYKVERMLGQGGAGIVYACSDTDLGRTVAIKLLHAETAGDASRKDRFLREGRLMAKISSPNVVSVYGFGEHNGLPYLVMEYVEGEDLERWLMRNRHPLHPTKALKYIGDAAQGLQAATKLGIVHRDVKPANIIVVEDDAKLTDFGLARPQEGSSLITHEGLITGTPAFISPERARGQAGDFRSDIYSLGATLYTLVIGRPPFVGDSGIDVIAAHLNEPVPRIKEQNPRLSDALDALVARMMDKEPQLRFQDYAELLSEIDEVVDAEISGFQMRAKLFTRRRTIRNDSPESATGVMGSLERMSVIEVVQMLEFGKKTARLEVSPVKGREKSQVFIQDGATVHCEHQGEVGDEAFLSLAQVTEGAFRIHYGESTSEKTVTRPTQFLILETLRKVDEETVVSELSELSDADISLLSEDMSLLASMEFEQTDPSIEKGLSDQLGAPKGKRNKTSSAPSLAPSLTPRATNYDGESRTLIVDSPLLIANELEPFAGTDPNGNAEGKTDENEEPSPWSEDLPQRNPERMRQTLRDEAKTAIVAKIDSGDDATERVPRVQSAFQQDGRLWLLPIGVFLLLVFVIYRACSAEASVDDVVQRIDSGEAESVLAEIDGLGFSEGETALLSGHANVALENYDAALESYSTAMKKNAVDSRALGTVIERLNRETPTKEIILLGAWTGPHVVARLREKVRYGEYLERKNAFAILGIRGDGDAEYPPESTIHDLHDAPTCLLRREALMKIKVNKIDGRNAWAAITAAVKRKDNACLVDLIREMAPQLDDRR